MKIAPTWNVLPTFSRKLPPAKITTFTVYAYYTNAAFYIYTKVNTLVTLNVIFMLKIRLSDFVATGVW